MEVNRKKILVVDDQVEIRELIDITLRGSEFDVIKAPGGREGVVMAREKRPDLIIMDIAMPGFDGYMTTKVLKRNPQTASIPIIFLTAKKTSEDLQMAIRVGGTDFITKPFDPSNLMTRIRRVIESGNILKSRATRDAQRSAEQDQPPILEKDVISFSRKGDAIVFTSHLGSISVENCRVYRDAFATIVADNVFKVVLDMKDIKEIDGAGLGLLISVNEAFKSYKGGVWLTYPNRDVNNRFSFITLNDLFHTSSNVTAALQEFQEPLGVPDNEAEDDDINICTACTYVNSPEARYCGQCGSNLVIGKGEKVLETLSRTISRKVIAEAQTDNVDAINKQRNFEIESIDFPREFNVEFFDDEVTVAYKAKLTDTRFFEHQQIIGISTPSCGRNPIPLYKGMSARLQNPMVGSTSTYSSHILKADFKNKTMYVEYSKDALIMHSNKQFSVAPKNPLPLSMFAPVFQNTGDLIEAKILELSRLRMTVFSEHEPPLDACIAISFSLPGGHQISSPLVMAKKGRQKYMYDVEFKVIDEKESSIITQYMYKRQIELARTIVT